MTLYYVATLSRYVLVDALDDASAREIGLVALHSDDVAQNTPLAIRVVRPATAEEIEFWTWHHDRLAREKRTMIKTLRPGDRIRLLAMSDDPDPLAPGLLGTVLRVSLHGCGQHAWQQIDVAWDNGRTLMLVSPPDQFELLTDPHHTTS